jgi:hypothetical protein
LKDGWNLENPSPAQLRNFWQHLRQRPADEIKIIYLAAHQSMAGEWDFPMRQLLSPLEWLPPEQDATVTSCFVILDACYARALAMVPAWNNFWGGPILYAASGQEETFELNFTERRPVDFIRRFPNESRWFKDKLGSSWSRRLSFLGLMWTQAALAEPEVNEPLLWCRAVAQRAVLNAGHFRRERSSRLASELALIP